MTPSVFVITVSDGVAHGAREDKSGAALTEMLTDSGFDVVGRAVVADETADIVAAITEAVSKASLVLTTGGTGFGPRDVTPEATDSIVERRAPGLVHLMLARGLESTPMAALSRPVAGTIGDALVVNLPGSPRGATENLSAIMGVISHALTLLAGDTEHN